MADEVQKLVDSNPNARGLVLIVTNDYNDTDDEDVSPLSECHNDGDAMRNTFEDHDLKFVLLETKKNRSASEIKSLIKQVTKCQFPSSYKYFIFVFSGHGRDNCILANDAIPLDIWKHIIDPLQPGKTSPATGEIVKLFFFDSCRGELEMQPKTKGGPTNQRGNYIIGYATMKEFVSYETKWMPLLAKHLKQRSKSVQEILSDVIERVRSEFKYYQNPEFVANCGTVYLYPGGGAGSTPPTDPIPPGGGSSKGSAGAPLLSHNPPSQTFAGPVSGSVVVGSGSIQGGTFAVGEKSVAGGEHSTNIGGSQTVYNNTTIYYPNPGQPSVGGAGYTPPSNPPGGSSKGSAGSKKLKPTTSNILLKLKEHGFPNNKWMDLAIGLGMGGSTGDYNGDNVAKILALVNDWTAGVVEEGRWESLVIAVKMSGQKIVAINLANDVGVPPPEDD